MTQHTHAEVAVKYFSDTSLKIEYSLNKQEWYEWTDPEVSPPFLEEWFYRIKEPS